ncbi:MAG: glycosyltransferase family 1 protein [Spirosoma sp.]|nr:glycosyltransferase family 1 protein [Spirosoma sp.]
MQVTFIIRSPGTGFSLETLFYGIAEQLSRGEQISPKLMVLPQISRGLKTIWQNIIFVKQANPEFVHITGDVHYAALITKAHKTVLTIPDCVLLSRTPQRSIRYAIFWLFWYYLPIRKAAIVTAISEKTRQELYQYIGKLADKVQVVPCHYDPAFTFNPKPFNAEKPTLLHIGTAPHKNLSRLVEAIEGLSCRLVIVGKLTNAEKENLGKRRIDYQQYADISQDQMIDLYGQCDIVTFVSLYEGFGMPILEGQVVGRPVVTSNLSPMTDVGGEGACYVDPTNIDDIRRGIRRVWQDETYRSELIRIGRSNAQRFSMERVTARYAALYESLQAG